jgi:hypothetical protein
LPAKWEYPAPEWPLNKYFLVTFGRGEDATSDNYHDRELEHWENLWKQGQAPMWLINKQETAVALYCRTLTLVEATMGSASAPLLSELRRAPGTSGASPSRERFPSLPRRLPRLVLEQGPLEGRRSRTM